jgi:hypothetical protein
MKNVAGRRREMSFAEIGRELGISASDAASIFYYAVRKLKRQCPYSLELLSRYADDLEAARHSARKVA